MSYNANQIPVVNERNEHDESDPALSINFSSWLKSTRKSLKKDSGTDVPCGDCNACCRSSYFIHIKPHETYALASIPHELLFPAPGAPKGHVLMGYDTKGRCPMLVNNRCSIYEDRPLTCRTYDCRVFPAAGIKEAGDDDKSLITKQLGRWQFTYPNELDRKEHSAVIAAASFLQEKADSFPVGVIPSNPTHLAIMAIKVYDIFLELIDDEDQVIQQLSDSEMAVAIMQKQTQFEEKTS